MARKKRLFTKHKLHLYFDENFPYQIIEELKKERKWQKKCQLKTAKELGNLGKDDEFHFQYCNEKDLTLITLDKDYLDDKKYPFGAIPGVVCICVGNDKSNTRAELVRLLNFLTKYFMFPRMFLAESKLRVDGDGFMIRARDFVTKEINQMKIIKRQTTALDIARFFNYPFINLS
jgi:predicted nuclease of predicted toxin-antitoxin system